MLLRAAVLAGLAIGAILIAAGWYPPHGPLARGSPVGTTLDGYEIGDRASCYQPTAYFPCDSFVRVALEGLDHQQPGHSTIVETGVYGWNVLHSETIDIVVFDLADGTRHGVRVLCGVGDVCSVL